MGSVKHTVSVKCVQVDRSGQVTSRSRQRNRLDAAEEFRGTRGGTATGKARNAARTTAAQANGKSDAPRFTVGCSTLTPKGRIASHAGGIEHASLLDAP
ncbi:hypothetical protein C7S16_1927 [Burkholderia thailandensis]|uniref:Uncharacterized protein n=1 Tax=Burkholderia thailandensis TaxID=57975 RepID=A0AAW9CYS4_BURTH|nr:hypothetical protein [Burkholderia thailandensis]MDW9253834.1 hypothetical protein [Burkholderia thailandensis]